MKRVSTVRLVFLLLASPAFIAGCGGGGGGGNSQAPTPTPSATATPPLTPTTVVPRLVIGWGERSRAIGGLTSALSAIIRLQGAKTDGSDLVFTVNREASLSGYTTTVSAPEAARLGSWPLTVAFFSEANGGGAPVGVTQATVELTATGLLPDVAISGVVTQVEVTPGQQVVIGQNSDFQWTARAGDGALVPVTPGSAFFTVTNGGDKLQVASGQAQGLVPGTASVTARVDGVNSAPATVRVTSTAVVTLAPNPAVVSINGNLNFTAQVSKTNNQNVTWSVVEPGGGTITADGRYQAPGTAGTYTIRAVSQYDTDKSATISVSVQEGSISVSGDFPESGGIGVEID